MDVFTHALLGAKTVYAVRSRRESARPVGLLLLAAIAAAFPDIDFALFLVNPLRFLADWHQGATHSIVLMPLWAALLAAVFVVVTGHRPGFRTAWLVCAIAITSHIVSDLITVYGTALFYPLSRERYSLETTFVIDPVFTAIVLAGLGLAIRQRSPSVARFGLGVIVLYVGAQGYLKHRAADVGTSSAAAQGLSIERMAALPQPFSPFNWKLIGTAGNAYHVAHLNLAGPSIPLPSFLPLAEVAGAYRPPEHLTWETRQPFGADPEHQALAGRLWQDPRFAPFRRFAVYPALSSIQSTLEETCVWFTDLRYDLPSLPDTFRYGFCRSNGEQDWELYRLRYFQERARQRTR